jgi:altronate dehydratase small subunit
VRGNGLVNNDAIQINNRDNVATALKNLQKGQEISITGRQAKPPIILREAILAGHKLALRDLKKGAAIIKYGEVIGAATLDISRGTLVHVHNVDGLRGRGDLS